MTKTDITYQKAIQEIEGILEKIESGEMDVDELSEKVKRVAWLLDICKKKLRATEEEVAKIINEIKEED